MSAWIYIGCAAGAVIICILVGLYARKHACGKEQAERAPVPWIFLLYSAFSIVSMCCALTYGNKSDTEEDSAPSIEADLLAKFTSLKNLLAQTEEPQICHSGCGLNPREWQSAALIPQPRQPVYADQDAFTHQSHSILPFTFNTQVAANLTRRELFGQSNSVSLSL